MNAKFQITITAITLAVAASLAGCTAGTGTGDGTGIVPKPTASQSAPTTVKNTAKPKPKPKAPVEQTVGSTITKDVVLPKDEHAYPVGKKLVVVKDGEPLPKTVETQVKKNLADVPAKVSKYHGGTVAANNAIDDTAQAAAKAESDKLGRPVAVFYPEKVDVPMQGTQTFWTAIGSDGGYPSGMASANRAEQLSICSKWAKDSGYIFIITG